MNTLKYWGSAHKLRARDRGLGVYGSRGSHVVKQNLSKSVSSGPVASNEQLILSTSSSATSKSLVTEESLLKNLNKFSSSSKSFPSLHPVLPLHQTITPLITTNLTIGLLSSRSFSNSSAVLANVDLEGAQKIATVKFTPGTNRVKMEKPLNLSELKSDLVKVVADQIDEIKQGQEMSIHRTIAQKFLKETRFQVTDDVESNLGVMTFKDKNHTVEVLFPLVEDPFEEAGQQQEEEEDLEDQPEDDEDKPVSVRVRSGKSLPEPWPKKHSLNINVTFHNNEGASKGRWHLTGFAGEDNRLYVEEMRVAMGTIPRKDAEGNDPIEQMPPTLFDELNNDLQDRIYDFLDEVGVDDRLAHYVKSHVVEFKNRTDTKFLQNLKSLMTEEEAQTKPAQSQSQSQSQRKKA